MKYILTLREWTLGGEPIEEDYKEFGTKDEVARYIVNTRWFTKKNFDSEHFKGKVIRSEDCWKLLTVASESDTCCWASAMANHALAVCPAIDS